MRKNRENIKRERETKTIDLQMTVERMGTGKVVTSSLGILITKRSIQIHNLFIQILSFQIGQCIQ